MSKPERERSQLKMSIVLTSEEKIVLTSVTEFCHSAVITSTWRENPQLWRKIFLHLWGRLTFLTDFSLSLSRSIRSITFELWRESDVWQSTYKSVTFCTFSHISCIFFGFLELIKGIFILYYILCVSVCVYIIFLWKFDAVQINICEFEAT